MKIKCKNCDLFLGDIEGKIRKNISYLCRKCTVELFGDYKHCNNDYNKTTTNDEAVDYLMGMFNMK